MTDIRQRMADLLNENTFIRLNVERAAGAISDNHRAAVYQMIAAEPAFRAFVLRLPVHDITEHVNRRLKAVQDQIAQQRGLVEAQKANPDVVLPAPPAVLDRSIAHLERAVGFLSDAADALEHSDTDRAICDLLCELRRSPTQH